MAANEPYSRSLVHMEIHSLLVRQALQAAQSRIGFHPNDHARTSVYEENEYSGPNGRVNATHIVVGTGWFDIHEYSTDMREPSDSCKRFYDLAELVRCVCSKKIEIVCRQYMASRFNVLKMIVEDRSNEMFRSRDDFQAELEKRLNAYLESHDFKAYACCVEQPHQGP